MNILIDCTQIPKHKVGVGIYAIETFSRISRISSDHVYFWLLQDDDDEFDRGLLYGHKLRVKSKFFRMFIPRFLLEQFYIPFLCVKHKIDILHSLHYSFPILCPGVKRVVTIHDLTFFIYPQLHTPIKRYFFRFFTRLACKLADGIICVSNSTKNDLQKYIHNIAAKVSVIPLAACIPSVSVETMRRVKLKFGIKNSFILFIGTLEPRKNISTLVKAYALLDERLKQENQLVLVGKKGWYYEEIFESIEALNVASNVIVTGFVTQEEKFALLASASVFVYPSIYEGFGLPVLEALGFALPVITSNISSLPEVAGNAAVLVSPANANEISNAMSKCVSDISFRKQLSSKAVEQFKHFSWDYTAQNTLQIYDGLFKK